MIWDGFLEEEIFEKILEGRRGEWLGFLRGQCQGPSKTFSFDS